MDHLLDFCSRWHFVHFPSSIPVLTDVVLNTFIASRSPFELLVHKFSFYLNSQTMVGAQTSAQFLLVKQFWNKNHWVVYFTSKFDD